MNRHSRAAGEDGQSLIEVLVAILVFSLLLVATLAFTSTTSADRLRTQMADAATQYATSLLNQQNMDGCGMAVASEPSAVLTQTQPVTTASVVDGTTSPNNCTIATKGSPVVPDGVVVTSGTYDYAVTVKYWWANPTVPAGGCSAYLTAPDNPDTGQPAIDPLTGQDVVGQPTILVRDIHMSWLAAGVTEHADYTADSSVPPDTLYFHENGLGGIVIQTTAGSGPWTLSWPSNGTTEQVQDYPDGAGCVWFPYLPVGTTPSGVAYTVTSPSGNTAIVSLTPTTPEGVCTTAPSCEVLQ